MLKKLELILFFTAFAFALNACCSNAKAQDYLQMAAEKNPSVTIYSLDGTSPSPTRYTQTSAYPENPYDKTLYAQNTAPTATPTTTEIKETTGDAAAQAPAPATPEMSLWGANWSGRANLGASLQTGNTEQDAVNADASLKAKWLDAAGDTKHRASIKADINIENEDDTTTEDNRSLDLAYDYFFAKQWFVNSTLGFEQDDIEQLDLRTNAGVGLGHQAFESEDLNLQYILGPAYLREEYENGDTDDSLAVNWSLDYDQKIWEDMLQIFHNHEIFVPTDDTDAYLFESKSGLRIPLKKGLVATGEIEFDWDNDPEPGIQEDDTTYALKLGYEWD